MKIKPTNVFFFYRKKILLNIMKAFIFFCCASVFSLTPNNILSQNIKIKIDYDKTISVDEVFDIIMDQTDYTFIYQIGIFQDLPEVNLEKGNIRINKLLEKSLTNGEFQFNLTDKNTILIKERPHVTTQEKIVINGVVTDKNGIPLPGLSVYVTINIVDGVPLVKGTSTDFDGNYKLSASVGQTITVSGIGYKEAKQVIETNKTTYNFILEEAVSELAEVVLTGYQTISRERVTGAYNTVSKMNIENNATQNIGSMLEGVIPGLLVPQDADGNVDADNIIIRGLGTMDNGSAPLIVVDGYPISGGFSTINPNDIETITVLKDAAAASIWGASAGNGVIVITTKRGMTTKKGNKSGGMQVSFSTFIKTKSKMNLDYLERADTKTTLRYEDTFYTDGNSLGVSNFDLFLRNYSPPVDLGDRSAVGRSGRTSWNFGVRARYDLYNGNITQTEYDAIRTRLSGIDSYDDIRKHLLVSPINKQYNLALATAGDKSSTRFSAVYNDNIGAFIGQENNQVLLNLNNTYKIKDWLSFNLVTMLQNSKSKNSGIGYGTVANLAPYESLIEADGSYSNVRHGDYDPTYLKYFQETIVNMPYDDITYNPLRDARENEFVSKKTNYRVNVGLDIKIIDGLYLKPSISYENFKTETRNYYGAESSTVKFSVINGTEYKAYQGSTNSIYDPNNAMLGDYQHIPMGAQLTGGTKEAVSTTYRNLLTYTNTFGKHNVNLLGGFESISRTTKGINNSRTYGFDDERNTYLIPKNDYWYGLWSGLKNVSDGRNFTQNDERYVSYFGNASYTYNNKYTVSGSARTDGANFTTEDKSQRFNPMYSAGISWNAKNENFLKDVDFINRLKVRVTTGSAGNKVGAYSTVPTLSYGTSSYYIGLLGNYASITHGNEGLRWERINTKNLGIDFSLFDYKLYGSIDFYKKHSKDLIATVDISPTLGSTRGTFNVGEMTNNGIELNLNSDFSITKDLKLTTTLNYAHNKSEVTSYADALIGARSIGRMSYVEGRGVNPVYAFVYGGMQDALPNAPSQITGQNPTIIGENGVTYGFYENIGQNGEDGRDVLKYMGSKTPPTIVGWNNTFSYKNFTLRARVTAKLGHVFRRQTFTYNAAAQNAYFHKDLEGLLDGNHDAMGLPALPIDAAYYYYRWSWYLPYLNTLVEDASHIRLRQVYLSYDMSPKVLSSIGVSSLRLFAQAENLGNIWVANNHGIDPDYVGGRAPEKTFTFGLNINF